jgi:ABC-type multidrug transport system ATPase subunit
MMRLRGITKSYGAHQVLAGVSADVSSGDITLIVGANGCGKTTTLRIVAGLSNPDAGDVDICGRSLATDRGAALAHLSYLPQSPRFHVHLSVADILAFYAGLRNVPSPRIADVADRWGLSKMLRVRTGRLSGGLRQRLALAVLFLADAPVLVLDEPGLSLDPDWRRILQSELRSAAKQGRTVVVSTHLIAEWDQHADRCLVLEGGRVGRELAPDRLRDAFPFSLPRSAAAATG